MPHYRLHRDPRSSHQQIARLVRRLGQSPLLDVGAAQGMLAQLLHERGGDVALDAVEPNPDWAAQARPFYRQIFATTIEEAPLPDATYRTVICADILEHTADPLAVLRRLRRAATEDALFIVSLPNVAHLAVRLLLLFGRFPQMERGILDRTHLHYYTRDTAEAMLRSAGLDVLRARPTGVPLDELWPRWEGSALFRALTRLQHIALALAPRLFGYQWVFLARLATP
jgi:2-polyprenyl-3-methyl-5-hydroxy-6-metoxy-1,4-benzoquinol methylase